MSDYSKVEKMMRKYGRLGASDSEPIDALLELCLDGLNGSGVEFPGMEWSLYEDDEKAVARLDQAAEALFHRIVRARVEDRGAAVRFIEAAFSADVPSAANGASRSADEELMRADPEEEPISRVELLPDLSGALIVARQQHTELMDLAVGRRRTVLTRGVVGTRALDGGRVLVRGTAETVICDRQGESHHQACEELFQWHLVPRTNWLWATCDYADGASLLSVTDPLGSRKLWRFPGFSAAEAGDQAAGRLLLSKRAGEYEKSLGVFQIGDEAAPRPLGEPFEVPMTRALALLEDNVLVAETPFDPEQPSCIRILDFSGAPVLRYEVQLDFLADREEHTPVWQGEFFALTSEGRLIGVSAKGLREGPKADPMDDPRIFLTRADYLILATSPRDRPAAASLISLADFKMLEVPFLDRVEAASGNHDHIALAGNRGAIAVWRIEH